MQTSSKIAKELFDRIMTTKDLKVVVDVLESLSQNKVFKKHSQDIVSDPNLTDGQKITQLLYLIRTVENPILYDFFSDLLDKEHLWMFHSDKIDYFDRFVQEFQTIADQCHILSVTTAVPLHPEDQAKIIKITQEGLGFRVLLDQDVNPSIVGGAQVKIENYLFDVSIRSKLHQFQAAWLKTLDDTEDLIGRNE